MEKMRVKISRWVAALFVTVLVLMSIIGCGSTENGTAAVKVTEETTIAQEVVTEGGTEAKEIAAESIESSAEVLTESSQESIQSDVVEEDGHYISKEEVALYIHIYGKLPSNFISKTEAEELGWKKKDGEAGQLHVVAPGMSIGGSYFGNYEGMLPEKKGRKYYECDINYVKGNRGAERIVYSNDGLIFYTGDHYETFEQLYPAE